MTNGPLKLIVHADDFGLSERVNEGILQAHRHGILTSTSIIASGDAFDHAISLCKSTPTLDLGIHLTLVEERPLLDSRQVPSLTDNNGRLFGHAKTFVKRYFAGQVSKEELRSELEAQVEKVVSQGIRITHLDGHQHLHVLPAVLDITVGLARKYDIPALRIPGEALSTYMLRGPGGFSRLCELLVLKMFCYVGNKRELSSPESFAGFFFGGNLSRQNLLTVLQNLPRKGCCELMCHPGLDDPDSCHQHWGYHWVDELEALTDHEIAEFVRQQNIELISYREFING